MWPQEEPAFGVVQAVSTYAHHFQTISGIDRSERNMVRTIAGDFARLDVETLQTLTAVLG